MAAVSAPGAPVHRLGTALLGPRGVAVLAAAVVVLGSADLVQHYLVEPPAALGLSLLRAAPLVLLLRWPMLAWCGVLAASMGILGPRYPVSVTEPWPWLASSLLAALPVLAVVGAGPRRPRVLVAVWLSVPLAGALALLLADPRRGSAAGLATPTVLAAVALGAGWLYANRTDYRALLGEQVRATDTERAAREVLRERARMARELHDVIAHGLSMVTVRADSAPHRLTGVTPEAAAEFGAIAEAARGALEDLRRVLGVLRDPDAAADSDPQPGLADLPVLARDATLSTDVTGPVPPAVQLIAYRVVQEALSNARRHAPGTAVAVRVATADGALRITVGNGPGGRSAGRGAGYGLTGMRERVEPAGGTLHAGPRPDGGWQVDVTLPVEGP